MRKEVTMSFSLRDRVHNVWTAFMISVALSIVFLASEKTPWNVAGWFFLVATGMTLSMALSLSGAYIKNQEKREEK